MSLKKKLGLGIASAALGISLVGGGTFAYFNDVEVNNSNFAAGTLDINVKGNDTANAIIDVKNIKPRDTMTRTFKLNNTGSLDVSKVILSTDYTVTDNGNNNEGRDLGEDIEVTFLWNNDKGNEVIKETTLANLKTYDVAERDLLAWIFGAENSGLKALTSDTLTVKFTFLDKGDQNIFQGDSLKLDWTFDAKQTNGERK
ncbi:TasA family protein [Cytobacillus oceanisediminis]|uniref:TasA family protein n=1 Tax=Cytobacillus oceanisediminis TaxID=665099 RepID=UPI001C24CA9B|nr:TasA family protein [Cytobacillus oceanisediminis]MBU8770755.1 M73 family metallopeptidase [Cytobacillus oceanisediminis]